MSIKHQASKGVVVTFCLAVVLGVAGCGSVPLEAATSSSEQKVGDRAQQRWDALVAGQVEKAYEFLSPGTRQARSLQSYKALIRLGFWREAKVERVECASQEQCKVTVVVKYLHRGSVISSPVFEDWVLVERQWWAVSG